MHLVVNPELATADQDLPSAVKALFGTSHIRVVKAVGNYLLDPNHSKLDDANLRILAAAAPMLNTDHLANLIIGLPKTNMNMAIKHPDLDDLRLDFQVVLTEVPDEYRHVVIADLIKTSTIRILELCPHATRTEQANAILSQHAHDTIKKRGWADVQPIVASYVPELISASDLALLKLRFGDREIVDRYFVLKHPATNKEDLATAFTSNSTADRSNAIVHPNATPEMLWQALDDPIRTVRARAAHSDNASSEMLLYSMNDAAVDVRAAAISNPTAPLELSLKGLTDDSPKVRAAVFANPNLPTDIISLGLDDTNELVRQQAALHTNASEVQLLKAVSDPEGLVRSAALLNEHASEKVLLIGVNDSMDWVSKSAAASPNATKAVLNAARGREARIAALRNQAAPREMARQVLDHPNSPYEFKLAAIQNPNLTEDDVLDVIDTGNLGLITEIVRERAATQATFDAIAASTNPWVIKLLAEGLDRLDPHRGMKIACQNPDVLVRISHGATTIVDHSTKAIIDHDIHLGAEARPKTWYELPGLGDVEFPTSRATNELDGKIIAGYKAELICNGRALAALRKRMGNCLDGYLESCLAGRQVIAKFEDPDNNEVYAAAWDADGSRLRLIETNSIGNQRRVPPALQKALESPLARQTNIRHEIEM